MKKIVVMSSNESFGEKLKKVLEDKLKTSDRENKTKDQIEVVTYKEERAGK